MRCHAVLADCCQAGSVGQFPINDRELRLIANRDLAVSAGKAARAMVEAAAADEAAAAEGAAATATAGAGAAVVDGEAGGSPAVTPSPKKRGRAAKGTKHPVAGSPVTVSDAAVTAAASPSGVRLSGGDCSTGRRKVAGAGSGVSDDDSAAGALPHTGKGYQFVWRQTSSLFGSVTLDGAGDAAGGDEE